MSVLFGVLTPLERAISALLALCKVLSVIALAIMVTLILGQIFFRYALNDAPNWTEEAARFGMIWMTGLMAPVAYRLGGFVAIDMLEQALGRTAAAILNLVLLGITLWLLVVLWERGLNNHLDTISGRGCSSTLRWPFGIEIGRCGEKFANRYQYAGLWFGINLLIVVNIEHILRNVVTLLGGGDRLTDHRPAEDIAGAS